MIKTLHNWPHKTIGYSHSQGHPDLLSAKRLYYHKLGHTVIQTKHIQITVGGSEAISMAFFATCEQGEEIIVFEPYYANYNSYAATNEVKLVPVLTFGKTGFHLPEKFEIEKN